MISAQGHGPEESQDASWLSFSVRSYVRKKTGMEKAWKAGAVEDLDGYVP